jgi:hypothetical protein
MAAFGHEEAITAADRLRAADQRVGARVVEKT